MVEAKAAPASATDSRLDQQIRERALLYDLQRSFNGLIDLAELLRVVIAKTKAAFGVESSAVLLIDPETNELYFPYVADIDVAVEKRFAEIRVPPGKGIVGWVIEHGATECIDDVSADPRWYGAVDKQSGMMTQSLLCTPLRGRGGVIGVIELRNKLTGSFTREDVDLIEALSENIGMSIDSAQRYGSVVQSEAHLRDQVALLSRQAARQSRFEDLVGQSPAMQRVFSAMESALSMPVTVLLQGETGTGKELVARAIHYNGPRRDRPFLPVNCGGLTETLLESELFGHKKGAFTGAVSDRKGVFEVADGGTIFLDEIGETSPTMQVRLLRVLEEGEVLRVGESIARKVDVRVISATHRDLEEDVRAGTFRRDLFYRLNAFPIVLPPLRERREDVPLIAMRLLERTVARFGGPPKCFDPEVVRALVAFDWPGNIRQLLNEIERAVAVSGPADRIELGHLSERFAEPRGVPSLSPLTTGNLRLKEARDLFEREYIAQVLEQHRGNASQAAKSLGISRVMLQNKIRRYGLRHPGGGARRA